MPHQLVLIPRSAADWRLDDQTRETGRKGVAGAREILRLADERAARKRAAAAASSSSSAAAKKKTDKPAA